MGLFSDGRHQAGPMVAVLLAWTAIGCSFDYGELRENAEVRPDLVMEDLEYVRVRDGEPVVRFQASRAERFEESQTMRVVDLSFEHFAAQGPESNTVGRAGLAQIDLTSGDAYLSGGVRVHVPGEDVAIETSDLHWADGERVLRGSEDGAVLIKRSDGTILSGVGFSADTRRRTWQFSGGVSGTYVEEDETPGDGTGTATP